MKWLWVFVCSLWTERCENFQYYLKLYWRTDCHYKKKIFLDTRQYVQIMPEPYTTKKEHILLFDYTYLFHIHLTLHQHIQTFLYRLQDLHIPPFMLEVILLPWFSSLLMACPYHNNLLLLISSVTDANFILPLIYTFWILSILLTLQVIICTIHLYIIIQTPRHNIHVHISY